MTLKKCTVTQLDSELWRVDADGWDEPRVVRHGPCSWHFMAGSDALRHSLDELLAAVGLTRHAKEETAEDRVRERVRQGEPESGCAPFHHVSHGDLAAILAELDRLLAQRPVDVEAVLAPIRSRVSAWEERCASLASSREAHIAKQPGVSPNYIEAGIAEVERWSFMLAVESLRISIAEAERIGRGE